MTQEPSSSVRLAVVNDYEVVVAGVHALLAPHRDRVCPVELTLELPTPGQAEVVLFETFGRRDRLDRLTAILETSRARVVVYSWVDDPEHVSEVLELGADGYVVKDASALELVEAVETVHAGGRVVPASLTASDGELAAGDWPGRAEGLSPRESEIVCLIVQGLSNQEIADTLYLSINSVKTYIRTAYRKMDVRRRSQAVVWGIDHGFVPPKVPALQRG